MSPSRKPSLASGCPLPSVSHGGRLTALPALLKEGMLTCAGSLSLAKCFQRTDRPPRPRPASAACGGAPGSVAAARPDTRAQRCAGGTTRTWFATTWPAIYGLLDYLDRYWDHLFGHPLARDSEGHVVLVVERTNNPAEYSFSQATRELLRRLGRAHLGRDMLDQPT